MSWINKEVKALMAKYNTTDPFELADYLEYELIPFAFSRIRGLLLVLNGTTYIGYNTNLPRRLQGLVVYHEIAHRLLHKGNYFMLLKNTYFRSGKFERQADRFVAELVLSERRPRPGETVYEFSNRHKVPMELAREIAAMSRETKQVVHDKKQALLPGCFEKVFK
ncbi:MAG: ImmA/IrrE family metallo-endopeptidase [Bacteroidales bacterium]|jgi:Zn-dependent peptidase ImmA (M78 family)|nr:ImmA/IrrE family metallo-endopeptidase [Bacteroidales bacterium]